MSRHDRCAATAVCGSALTLSLHIAAWLAAFPTRREHLKNIALGHSLEILAAMHRKSLRMRWSTSDDDRERYHTRMFMLVWLLGFARLSSDPSAAGEDARHPGSLVHPSSCRACSLVHASLLQKPDKTHRCELRALLLLLVCALVHILVLALSSSLFPFLTNSPVRLTLPNL